MMGLFDFLSKKSAKPRGKGKRGPAKTADERDKLRLQRWLDKHPEMEDDYYRQKAGISGSRKTEVDIALEFIDKLQKKKLWPKDTDDIGRGGSELAEILKEIAPTAMGQQIGAGIGFLMARAGGLPAEAAAQNTTPAPQPQQLAPPQPIQQPAQIQQPEGEMSLVSAYVLSEFQKRDPKAAATWLLSLPYPQIQQVVPVLCSTEDSQLPHVMAQLGLAWPDIAPTCNWLLSQSTYLNGLIAALREAMPKGEEEEKPHRGL